MLLPPLYTTKKDLEPKDEWEKIQSILTGQNDLPYIVSTDNTELPYATKEIAQQYVDILIDESDYDEDNLLMKLSRILPNYNLDAIIFEGNNHKKGLKDCLGNILVPAIYDGFDFIPKPFDFIRPSLIAVREGKYVLVTMDGTGKELSDLYDEIHLINYGHPSSPYVYRKNDLKAWGLMNLMGEELCDCIIDSYSSELNEVIYKVGNRYGFWQYNVIFLEPIYNNIEMVGDFNNPILFTLDGVQGYVRFDGSFLPLTELEKLDEAEQHDIKLDCICVQYD